MRPSLRLNEPPSDAGHSHESCGPGYPQAGVVSFCRLSPQARGNPETQLKRIKRRAKRGRKA